jgi:hypothetical protein
MLAGKDWKDFQSCLLMIFIFLNFFEEFFFGVLYQAVRAVSKNRPKYPMLDIPFIAFLMQQKFWNCHHVHQYFET